VISSSEILGKDDISTLRPSLLSFSASRLHQRGLSDTVMTPLAIVLLAFSMSSDAFAAALGKGAVLQRPSYAEALRVGIIFGSVETITPVVGWLAGRAASGYIAAFDHWIAFGLLVAIGAKMVWDSVRRLDDAQKPRQHSFGVLVATAIGTSIDAMAVGVTLALIDADIIVTALAIGMATFAVTTLGILFGRMLGGRFGRLAEAAGGFGLIFIGTKILVEHTMGG
jgi:putative Mn2+ efflux pump MntP